MKKKHKHILRCKNCGAACTSKYCPECGQALTVGRLDNRTFFTDLLSGLLRINRGFIYTAARLLAKPWTVIRDYIRGRRVAYTPPLNMLILLCFFGTVLSGLAPAEIVSTSEVAEPGAAPASYSLGLAVAKFLRESPALQVVLLNIPALLAVPIVYGRKGARRYNFAELFCALLYMADALLAAGIIISLLQLVLPATLCDILQLIYTLGIIGLSLFKAFPMPNVRTAIAYFIAYLLQVLTFYALIVAGIFFFAVN